MRYFFLIFTLLMMLVLLIFPNRLGKFAGTEWILFPDMDYQDKVLGQRSSNFFADGRGARTPDKNIVPMGYAQLTDETRDQHAEFGFTNGEYEELGINDLQDARQFLAQGEERYNINCATCHGVSANGEGVVKARSAQFGGIPNLMTSAAKDGYVFEMITNGRGMMASFKHNTSIRDRWAIAAYLRALKDAKKAADEKE